MKKIRSAPPVVALTLAAIAFALGGCGGPGYGSGDSSSRGSSGSQATQSQTATGSQTTRPAGSGSYSGY